MSRGYTLIELLVVIAIVGIIASIVLTAINSSPEHKAEEVRQGIVQ